MDGILWGVGLIVVLLVAGWLRKLSYESKIKNAAIITENIIRKMWEQENATKSEEQDEIAKELIRQQAYVVAKEHPENFVFTLQTFCLLSHNSFKNREMLFKTLFELLLLGQNDKIISLEQSRKLNEYFDRIGITRKQNNKQYCLTPDNIAKTTAKNSIFVLKTQRQGILICCIGAILTGISFLIKKRNYYDIYDIDYSHGILFWIGIITIFIGIGYYCNLFNKINNWIKSGK